MQIYAKTQTVMQKNINVTQKTRQEPQKQEVAGGLRTHPRPVSDADIITHFTLYHNKTNIAIPFAKKVVRFLRGRRKLFEQKLR